MDLIHAFWGAILAGVVPSIMPFLTEKLSPEQYRHDLKALISVTRPAAIVTYPDFEQQVREALAGDSVVRAVISTGAVPAGPELGGITAASPTPSPSCVAALLRHNRAAEGGRPFARRGSQTA